jgi:hypothetical protein
MVPPFPSPPEGGSVRGDAHAAIRLESSTGRSLYSSPRGPGPPRRVARCCRSLDI